MRVQSLVLSAAAGSLLLHSGVQAQICNSNDPEGGGLVIPAFSSGGAHWCLKNAPEVDPLELSYQNKSCTEGAGCVDIALPCVPSEGDPSVGFSFLYGFVLLWCFSGVGIIADIFMEAIAVITSKFSVHKEETEEGKTRTVEVLVWNATVANLTLMALGSSAPEILLNVIEVFSLKFYAGDLGPSTIVGSAAFNLLVIMAVCVTALEGDSTRKIDDLLVFGMTAISSVFAYIWLLLILQAFSPNVITLTEALLTFLFFPVLVILAWSADTGRLHKWLGPCGMKPKNTDASSSVTVNVSEDGTRGFDAKEIAKLMKGNLKTDGDMTEEEIGELAAALQIQATGGQNRARRRANAGKSLFGGKKQKGHQVNLGAGKAALDAANNAVKVEVVKFSSPEYSCKESDRVAKLTVTRPAMTATCKCEIDYQTVDGTAKGGLGFTPGVDFEHIKGALTFAPGETSKEISVTIFEDAEPEEDEYFTVTLGEVRCDMLDAQPVQEARVTVIDTSGPPDISFEAPAEDKHGLPLFEVNEDAGEVRMKVLRTGNADGTIKCMYHTTGKSASAGDDYEDTYEDTPTELVFGPNEIVAEIVIKIMDDEDYEKDESFSVTLTDAEGATLENHLATVKIINNDAVARTTDMLVKHLKINWGAVQGSSASYKQQFTDALAGPDAEDGKLAMFLHVLNVPWKLLFALVPPPNMCGGWLCFFFGLAMIGGVTALIGDFANHLGCSLGWKSSVTAITWVALGTSLPDTFASKAAAVGDANADAAIGNVTGSNSVNVFLGLGLPWLIAAIAWTASGATSEWTQRTLLTDATFGPQIVADYPDGVFVVPAGSLGFSVTVFAICAVVCLLTIVARRKKFGYELGGKMAKPTGAFFVFLWFFYVTMSSLQAYDVIFSNTVEVAAPTASDGLGGGWIALIVIAGIVVVHIIVIVAMKKCKDATK